MASNWFDTMLGKRSEPQPEPLPLYRASTVIINLGVLVLLEEIVGGDKLALILEQKQARVSMAQKRRILIEVLGYDPGVADRLDPEVFDAEMSLFFSRWLQRSLQAQIKSSLLPLSSGVSPTQLRDNISRFRNS